MRSRLLLIGSILACASPAIAGDDGPRKAVYTANELRARLLEAQRSIKGLRVVYRCYDYDAEKYPRGSYLYRIIAVRSPHDLYHVSCHGHDRLDWRDDPFQQRAIVTKDRLDNEYYVNRVYFESRIRPEEGLPGSLPNEFFFIATGLWPLEGRQPPRPDGRAYVLREVAASADYSRVRTLQEEVDGRWCHVLEFPGYDRLWIDVEHGCALLARETHSQSTGALVQRIELGGHREVAPGIWMPARMRNIQFDHTSPNEEGRRRIYRDATHEILDVEVNRVEEGLFTFRPRPGSMRWTHEESLTQVQPDGLDHLDELARWVGRNFPRDEPKPVVPIPPASATVVAAVLLIVGCEVLRRRAGPSVVAQGGSVSSL
jgi:hypothetical protein